MEFLLTKEAVFLIAVLGGLVSVLDMGLRRTGRISLAASRRLYYLSYALMAISITLFLAYGMRLPAAP